MFQFEFERGLLRFKLNKPALDWLFQLPPRIAYCYQFPVISVDTQ